jgi:hypothetical protein
MLADAMKSYPKPEDTSTRDCVMERLQFFGSTKCKLNLPSGANCDSQQPDKVNYFICRLNTRASRQRIESLSYAIHGLAHTIFVLFSSGTLQDYHPTQPNDVRHYRP